MEINAMEINAMEINAMGLYEPFDFGPLPPLEEIPPPPILRRQYAVDANGNDPTIVPHVVLISMGCAGG
jgi:hypothetical protein